MTKDDNKKLDKILAALNSLTARVARIEAGGHAPNGTSGKLSARAAATKMISVREFLLEHSPATDVQRTLAVGYFLEKHADMASFNKTDLEKGYRDARESPPSNVNVNVNMCIKHGHMMEADEKKANKTAWVLTRRGEEFVLGGFPKPRAASSS